MRIEAERSSRQSWSHCTWKNRVERFDPSDPEGLMSGTVELHTCRHVSSRRPILISLTTVLTQPIISV